MLRGVPAEHVNALWRGPKDKHMLMQLFAASLEDGPPMTEDPPADLIIHLVDTLLPGGQSGFEIRLHCFHGTYVPDAEAQNELAPDAATRVDDELSIDKFLRAEDPDAT